MIGAGAPGRWAVLRASLIHGAFDTKNVAMLIRAARFWPAIPVIGGARIKLQPLYVGDVAQAFDALIDGRGPSGSVYTISGPRQERLVDMIRIIQERIGRHVPLVPVPLAPARVMISAVGRLFPFLQLPRQQVEALHDHPMYRYDEAATHLNFSPRTFAEAIKEYI